MATCETRTVPFVLVGAGGVGAALLEAIVGARALHKARYGIRFSALAVCDSSAAVSGADAAGGLSDAEIAALIAHKASGGKLASQSGAVVRPAEQDASVFLESLVDKYSKEAPDTIVVDCSATDATVPALLKAATTANMRAASANKKPFADSSFRNFRELCLAPTSPARVRYESSVGAGLPVIAALARVVSAHDAVTLISGSFSGTLGYVMSGLQAHAACAHARSTRPPMLTPGARHAVRRPASRSARWLARPRSSATRSPTLATTSAGR